MHAEYGGVVPELASRDHVRRVVPLLRGALSAAGKSLADIDAVAYTRGPGLSGALLVGCASPAPELPRHVVQVSDPGFASTTPLVSVASLSERRSVLVTRSVWDVLSDEEQKTLNDQYQIKLLEDDQFGQVMCRVLTSPRLGQTPGRCWGAQWPAPPISIAACVVTTIRQAVRSRSGCWARLLGHPWTSRPWRDFSFDTPCALVMEK
jgi:hypothetical protein